MQMIDRPATRSATRTDPPESRDPREARQTRLRAPGPQVPSLPLHDARLLTEGGDMARIALDGQVYTLRITRQGKLILTK
ncbi:hypothetical protein LNKW23_22740 [Paralimibaculum aggregatum]|uniref:Hemin uptake protein HemP n=1 Tax=Paralimibaculum aggregatum TaxID=3036245 RepID=A0ABQ6LQM4_9RHOB|nr:hypothetical protein LNKW23_22740 [Limibaculum sp. NKW23]